MQITINQALNFWDSLVVCYFKHPVGYKSVGTDTVEIYPTQMMEHSPIFESHPEFEFSKEAVRRATSAMYDLILRFQKHYHCKVECEELVDLSELPTSTMFCYHFRVIHASVKE